MTISWNPLTQRCEEIDYGPILLTAQQYIDQLLIGSDQWFVYSAGKGFCLVDNSRKWTLVYKADDCSWVKLQRGQETTKVSAQDFVDQYMFDHAV